MKDLESEPILERLKAAVTAGRVISYGNDTPDKECPEVRWAWFGLIDTNEIVVVAQYRDLEFAIAEPSPLIYPAMADRIFGIDVADGNLTMELSKRLWPKIRKYLD